LNYHQAFSGGRRWRGEAVTDEVFFHDVKCIYPYFGLLMISAVFREETICLQMVSSRLCVDNFCDITCAAPILRVAAPLSSLSVAKDLGAARSG